MKHFDADKPIQTSSQDLLGRSQYAKALAKAIIEQEGDDSHVIGLYGVRVGLIQPHLSRR